MGNTQTIFLPPWVPTTDEEKLRASEFTEAVLAISAVPRNFVEPDSVASSPEFPFDWTTHRAFAEAAYRNDTRIYKLLPRLVPKHVPEEEFWRNYFSHVFAVKCRFAGQPAVAVAPTPPSTLPPDVPSEPEPISALPADPPADVPEGDTSATRLARAASITSQLPYPERFEHALKYVREGPSLPSDAAPGDRILMDVLSQQATLGQCSTPRPGIWDTAEAKARHEAWVKLGSMSKHEAMHLYVQALEIFRKDWVLWEGLHMRSDMLARADAVSTPKRELAPPASRVQPSPLVPVAVANAPPAPLAAPPPPTPQVSASLAAALPEAAQPTPGSQWNAGAASAPGSEKIFLLDISPSSRAVALLLNLLPNTRGIEVRTVGRLADLPEPVQKGCAKLPLLLDEQLGFELWDGHAIMCYLVDKYASPSRRPPDFHFPTDIGGKAKVLQFLAYRQATLWPAVRDHVFAQLFPASPVCPVSRGPALREFVDNADRRLQMELNRLNTVFLEQDPYLTGTKPSAADVSCACALSLLDWVSSPQIESYPNVAMWFASVARLPGYKEAAKAHLHFAATPNNVQQGHFALALIE